MNLRDRARRAGPGAARSDYSFQSYLNDYFSFGGTNYALNQTYAPGRGEGPPNSFTGYSNLYRGNGVVFACLLVRLSLFSEARFGWRRQVDGRSGDLFSTPELGVLEHPNANTTTGGLLARLEQDSSLAGNAFVVRIGDRLERLRPDWVTIFFGSPHAGVELPADDPDSRVIGYSFGDPARPKQSHLFSPEQVAHFAPIPDPTAMHRGMSWLTPVLRELDADDQATQFKGRFFRNSATPNMIVTIDKDIAYDKFLQFKESFELNYEGALNAFKTIILGAGADAKVVGSNFEQMSFKAVQAAGETRIAAAAGVPPVIVGLSEGLGAATYSNYSQARRRLADGTARPWWREASASLERLLKVPTGARLDIDPDGIAFLRDDAKDIAEIQQGQAQAIKALTEAGFQPDSVVDAVVADDMARLKGNHTNLFSVQLQKAGGNDGAAPTPEKVTS